MDELNTNFTKYKSLSDIAHQWQSIEQYDQAVRVLTDMYEGMSIRIDENTTLAHTKTDIVYAIGLFGPVVSQYVSNAYIGSPTDDSLTIMWMIASSVTLYSVVHYTRFCERIRQLIGESSQTHDINDLCTEIQRELHNWCLPMLGRNCSYSISYAELGVISALSRHLKAVDQE